MTDNASVFDQWSEFTDTAIEFAKQYPEPYRPAILQAILMHHAAAVFQASGQEGGQAAESPGLQALAEELDSDVRSLTRVVDVTEDGAVRILARIDGRSIAETANRYASVLCFVNEYLGKLNTDIEELRTLCKTHGCYNQANFTRYFRDGELILEIGKRGSRDKRYRLSPTGEQVAIRILKDLVGD